jgi:predicted nucleic acid-binding protein
VVVPALAPWHEDHARAFAFLDHEPGVVLIGHVALETYSVLTRMPPPKRARPDHVAQALRETFPDSLAALSVTAYLDLIDRAARGDVQGGGVYDALVAATAQEAGLKLISLDQRAAATYAVVGAAYELL